MLFLSLRHLLSRRRQTILVLLGISLGTMMFLVISGVQKGVQDYVLNQLLNNTPHIRIEAHEEKIEPREMSERFFGPKAFVRWKVPPSGRRDEQHIEYPQGWFDRLAGDPRVLGYSSGIFVNVIASRGPTKSPAQLFGIIPENYVRLTSMESYMREGSLSDLKAGGGKLILGAGVKQKLGAELGDTLLVSMGQGEPMPFRVAGYFKMGITHVDDQIMYVALQDAQRLNRSPGRVGVIEVYLEDPMKASEIAAEWAKLSRDKVESWDQMAANFLQVFTIQKFSRMIITLAILIVAAFGTYNVLSILVNQKRREIAILRSIGFPPPAILRLFLSQGLALGIGGAFVGLFLGHLANLYISRIDLGFNTGMGNHLPVSFDPMNYVVGIGLAIASAVVASYLPARAAAKLTPIDIIRSEG